MWKDKFNENNLILGKRMYDDKKVSFIHKKGEIIDAEVTDDFLYYIHIKLNDNKVEKSSCSCALDKGLCIHVVAVLNDIFYDEQAVENTENVRNEMLLDLLSSIDRDILEKFIFNTLLHNPELEFQFSNFMSKYYEGISKFDMIDKIFNEFLIVNNSSPSLENFYRLQELNRILADSMEEYIQQLHFNAEDTLIIEMIDYVLTHYPSLDQDIESLMAYNLFNTINNCLDYIYLNEDSNMDLFTQSIIYLLNDHFDDNLFNIIYRFVKNNFDLKIHFPYALDILDVLIEKLNEIDIPNYYSNSLEYDVYEIFQTYLTMADSIDNERKKLFLQKHSQNISVIDYQIDEFIAKEDLNSAKVLLITQLDNGIIHSNYIKLERIYNIEEDKENLIKLYKNIVMYYSPGHHWYVSKLHSFYNDDSIKSVITEMVTQMNDNSAINSLLRRFELFDLLVDNVTSNYELDEFKLYHDNLKSIYPDKIYPLYEQFLNDMAITTSNRENYKYMVDLLRDLEKINGGKEIIERIKKHWKEKYFKRTAMMDELGKL